MSYPPFAESISDPPFSRSIHHHGDPQKMAARITLSTTDILSRSDKEDDLADGRPSYWSSENHVGDSYLRAENWKKDMEDLTLPGKTAVRSSSSYPIVSGYPNYFDA